MAFHWELEAAAFLPQLLMSVQEGNEMSRFEAAEACCWALEGQRSVRLLREAALLLLLEAVMPLEEVLTLQVAQKLEEPLKWGEVLISKKVEQPAVVRL